MASKKQHWPIGTTVRITDVTALTRHYGSRTGDTGTLYSATIYTDAERATEYAVTLDRTGRITRAPESALELISEKQRWADTEPEPEPPIELHPDPVHKAYR